MKRLVWLALCLGSSGLLALGQEGPDRELFARRDALSRAEDSTLNLLNENRRVLSTLPAQGDPAYDRVGQDIVRLERELFTLRDQLRGVNNRIATFGTATPEGVQTGGETGIGGGESKTLFYNAFFGELLPKNEVTLFALAPKVEPLVGEVNGAIGRYYTQLEGIKREYEAAKDQAVVDSLALVASALKEQIERQDAVLERQWLMLYRRKIDVYPVLIDRIGRVDRTKRELLDQESRLVRRAEGLAAQQLAPLVAAFPLQKRLALNYEIIMAEALGLRLALDSLLAEYQRTPAPDAMVYADIAFPPRSLVVYGAIKKPGEEVYATMDDVPTLQLPRAGIYYAIQLSIYTNPPAVTVFKGYSPLRRLRLADGRVQYVAGGFRTYAEAQVALTQMRQAGFRAPVLVAWVDGMATTGAKAKALETARAAETAKGVGYSVDIVPEAGRLAADLREIIAAYTADRPQVSIVRHPGGAGGEGVVYSVGNFGSRAVADALAGALSGQAGVRVQVTEVK